MCPRPQGVTLGIARTRKRIFTASVSLPNDLSDRTTALPLPLPLPLQANEPTSQRAKRRQMRCEFPCRLRQGDIDAMLHRHAGHQSS